MGCGSGFGFGGSSPQAATWEKISFVHTQFQAAALQNDIQAFSLLAKQVIHGLILVPTIQFAGAGITDYKISVGLAADFERYMLKFDVDTVVAGTNLRNAGPLLEARDVGAAVSVRVAAFSTGANLNASTAGAFDLYVWRATLP